MANVYSDASSLILLYRAGLFEQTARTFSLVLAGEVYRELCREGYPGAELFRDLAASRIITVLFREPDYTPRQEMAGFLAMDRGRGTPLPTILNPILRPALLSSWTTGRGPGSATAMISPLLMPFWFQNFSGILAL